MRGGWMQGGAVEEELSRAEASKLMGRLWRMLRPYRSQVFLAGGLLVAQTACLLAGPALVRYGVDNGVIAGDAHRLNVAAVTFLVVAILGAVLARSVIRVVGRTGESFLRDLRLRVFRHLSRLGLDFYEREKTGKLVSRMTSDVDVLQELVQMGLVMLVQNVLIFVGAIVVLLLMSWQLTLFTLLVVPPVVIASRWFRRESNRAYLEVRDRIAVNLSTLQEGLAGVRVVQAYGREGAFVRRFRTTNEAQYDANLETVSIASRYFPVVEMSGIVGTAVVIGVGGWFVTEDIVTVGTVMAFVLYLANLFEPVQQLSQLYNTVQQAGAGLHKLFDLLDTRSSIEEKAGAVDLPTSGAVEVRGVSFAYGDEDVLTDVSLDIAPGERLALVGPTGAGKSTLAKLLARFYDPRVGTVTYGGVDLRDATLASLRDRIVVVPQEGFLFAGTVAENIRVAKPDAADEEIRAALDSLGLRARFEGFPDGLDTDVRERGSRLSAGERQLVSLVRAALADPAFLVLDEATSNLDPGTEREVEHAMEALMEGRTVVVVAHRLSTAARADRVAVVDDGRLAEIGTHDELLARGDRYADLFSSWTAGVTS